jgi:hypothetical protein
VSRFTLRDVFLATTVIAIWLGLELAIETWIFGQANGVLLVFLFYPAFFGGATWLVFGSEYVYWGIAIGLVCALVIASGHIIPALVL